MAPAEVASKVELVEVARGLARPVLVTFAPGDPRKRLFVLEQFEGNVRVIENGKVLPKPYLTITGLSSSNEQGLLGLAFHPKFATNGKLYVNYTTKNKNTHIVEFHASSATADEATPIPTREIVEIEQPFSNHNGGGIAFGPDGKLYAGMGDGGSAGDPKRNGQNPRTLLAKMLRFDVDATPSPASIIHMGLRNPWRFSFDRATGDLYIGDVGQNLWENIFVVAAKDPKVKHNFGWNVVEGNHCYEAETCKREGFTPAVVDYPHEQGCSITGGFVYRGTAIPVLAGRYFYADFCTGILRSFKWTAPDVVREHWDWKAAIDKRAQLQEVSSFGEDEAGELYIATLGPGVIFKLVPKP